MRWFLIALALAACDTSTPDAPDSPDATADAADDAAPDGPLTCLGQPGPATAPDPLAIEGKVFAVVDYQVSPVAGATVELRRGAAVLTTATTGADGGFVMSIASDGRPVDAWFSIETPGRLPTHAHGDPLIGGENAFLLVADAAEVAAWYADAGAAHAAGMRTVITSVKDCANDSPAAVTVATAPAAAITYYDEATQRWDPALTAATNGFVLATDAPASLTLTPSIGATALPPRTLTPTPDALTLLLATPRTR